MPDNRIKEHNKKMKNTVIFIQKNLYVFSFISIILIFVFFYLLHISLSLAAAISAIIISIDGIYLSRESSILPAKLKNELNPLSRQFLYGLSGDLGGVSPQR